MTLLQKIRDLTAQDYWVGFRPPALARPHLLIRVFKIFGDVPYTIERALSLRELDTYGGMGSDQLVCEEIDKAKQMIEREYAKKADTAKFPGSQEAGDRVRPMLDNDHRGF